MEWLNYHHLLYYWMVVRTGSVAAASTELKLASPTISVQIRRLEEQLGEKLLRRSGRHVVPTEMGQVVYRYADEIFALGRELVDTARGRPTGRPMHVVIGVHDVIPKSIARWLIEPALKLSDPVRITCREGSSEQLLAELSVQRVDVVLADAPISPTVKVRAYNHLLGETGLSFLGVPRLARKYRPGFPKSLHDAPMLIPTPNTAVRRALDQWFEAVDIRPRVIGEFDDSELRWEFGGTGIGVFSAPLVLETHLARLYNVQRIGWAPTVLSSFYAISVERKLKHPAAVAICEAARHTLFAKSVPAPSRRARARPARD
jgi:LysR family transcriptional regulator, transcriptional activator of nhaA